MIDSFDPHTATQGTSKRESSHHVPAWQCHHPKAVKKTLCFSEDSDSGHR